jgi:hypothetical protein
MEWIYSAIIASILAGLFGIGVGALVLRRVVRTGEQPRPVVTWLLGALTALALAQVMEQSRTLLFRLSYDGLVDRGWFLAVYDATWNVASSKIIAAVALTVSSAVMLGLYMDRPEPVIVRWGAIAGVVSMVLWVAMAWVLDGLIP